MAVQAPLSTLAARTLSPLEFMAFTQFALLFSIPFLIMRADSRRDFMAIVLGVRNWPKLAMIFLVGVTGLALYDVGLSSTHPIITAAVLNLTPFWAALIAFVVSRRKISISPFAFFGCFLMAFFGAMVIAWSQIDVESKVLARDVMYSFMHSRWIYALPAPAFFALSGTLVFKWFSDVDEPAAIAANFVVSSLVLIPVAVVASDFGRQTHLSEPSAVAILLLLVGHVGRVRRGAGLLSNGLDRHGQRQRLRHDVFPVDATALRAHLFHAVALDPGFAIQFPADVFRRRGAGDGSALDVVANFLAGQPASQLDI